MMPSSYMMHFIDSDDTVIKVDEIQESSEMVPASGKFTRQLKPILSLLAMG